MAIKAVLFDYGGVLTAAGKHGSMFEIITEIYGIDIGRENLDDLHDQLRRSQISTQTFFEELAKRHQSPKQLSTELWEEVSHDVFERSEPVYEFAQKLRETGVKTGILSNVYQMTADKLRAMSNYDGFDPVILSSEVKMAKPDREIFQLAVDRLGVKGDEIIFV